MFMIVGKKRCPTCGVIGKKWKKVEGVSICPRCDAYFNEFGFIIKPEIKGEVSFS